MIPTMSKNFSYPLAKKNQRPSRIQVMGLNSTEEAFVLLILRYPVQFLAFFVKFLKLMRLT